MCWLAAYRLRGKALAPQARRDAIRQMIEQHQVSERRACRLAGLSRDSYRHPPRPSKLNAALGEQNRKRTVNPY